MRLEEMKRLGVKRMREDVRNIPKPTVVVIDKDLSTVRWFGKILGEAGYQVIPALNIRQATSLLDKLQVTPDLVIANPSLLKIIGLTCLTK